jgi:DNA-directed RNA polymerase subunit RPC12/RpoP
MSPKAAMIMLMCFIGIPLFWIIMVSIVSSSSRKKYKVNVTKKEIIRPNVANKIKMIKPDFKEDEFLKEGFNIYKDVQVAWMNFDLESVRNLITDEMFNMYQSQLAVMEASNEQNIMKDMIMQDGYIVDAVDQNGVLTIVTQYIIDQYDYVADRTTGKLIRGESKYKMRVEYLMKFRLNIDASQVIDHCPNCGAKIEKINGSGVCEYCGSKIVSENKNWVLTEKQVINQDYI